VTPRRAFLAAVVLLGLSSAAPAHAAACCLSSSAFGIGRLALWEDFAVILGGSVSPVIGRWDERGGFRENPARYSEVEWRAQLSALVALHPRLQVSARLPYVLTQKASDDLRETGAGIGDALAALRYEPVYQGEYSFLPEVALTGGVTVPSGRAVGDGSRLLQSDVTGRGAWVLSAALTTELARDFWFVQLGAGVTVPLQGAAATPGHTEQFGVGLQATLAGGVEVRKGLVVSAVARFAYEGNSRYDGAVVPRSEAYDFGLGPALAWQVNPHWTLQGGADFSLPVGSLGLNRQGRVTGNLGVRYAYF
jgi:hypothetical protein